MKKKLKYEKQLKYLEDNEKQRLETLKNLVTLHKYTTEALSKETSNKLKLSIDFIDWYFYHERSRARDLLKNARRKDKKRIEELKTSKIKTENLSGDEEVVKNLKIEPI